MKNKERLTVIVMTIAVLGIITYLLSSPPVPEGVSQSGGGVSSTLSGESKNGGTTPTKIPSGGGSTISATMSVTSPLNNNEWVIGETHLITWSKAAGIPGSIYLVNAATGATVGWITPTTATNQTSYSWNTKEVALSRTNPQRKDLATGKYIIKIEFDRKPALRIESAPFSIIYPSQEKFATYNIFLSNFKFNPASLSVRKGDTIVIANKDLATYKFTSIGLVESFSIAQSGVKTINTGPMAPGSYGFYSEAYPTARFNFTITD